MTKRISKSFVIIMLLLLLSIPLFGVVSMLSRQTSDEWVGANAEIYKSEIVMKYEFSPTTTSSSPKIKEFYIPVMSYKYSVDGEEYYGAINPVDYFRFDSEYKARYLIDTQHRQLTVKYKKDDPTVSYVYAGSDSVDKALMVIYIVFLILFIASIYYHLRKTVLNPKLA